MDLLGKSFLQSGVAALMAHYSPQGVKFSLLAASENHWNGAEIDNAWKIIYKISENSTKLRNFG